MWPWGLRELLEQIDGRLARIERRLGQIMAGQQELETEVQADVQAEHDMETRLDAVIAALQAHPAAPDLSPQIAELQALRGSLGGFQAQAPAPPAAGPTT